MKPAFLNPAPAHESAHDAGGFRFPAASARTLSAGCQPTGPRGRRRRRGDARADAGHDDPRAQVRGTACSWRGDRRATAGNIVVYDRADKVLEIDRHSVMAIAGVPATAWEMARVLEHSFQYYRRTQLQEMSVGGKVRALSKLLRDNFGLVMQGVGVVVPLFATYDHGPKPEGKLFFYDVMGANFEVTEYASTGSGSPAVRGVLYYENTWGAKPLREYSLEEALRLTLRALDTAAEADTATGGVDRNGRIFPVIKIITAKGITTVEDQTLRDLFNAGRHLGVQPLSAGVPVG